MNDTTAKPTTPTLKWIPASRLVAFDHGRHEYFPIDGGTVQWQPEQNDMLRILTPRGKRWPDTVYSDRRVWDIHDRLDGYTYYYCGGMI